MAVVPPALALSMAARRADIELLRVVACAGVVLLHALLIFSPEPLYHLKAAVTSPTAGLLAEALRITTMPLFFLLAGWAAIHSLRRRDARGFLRDRVQRLVPPLLTGMALFCPFIKYIELSGGRDLRPAGFRLVAPTHDTLLQFLPKFFTRLSSTTWSHLWFLVYLLVISVALLPVLLRMARTAPPGRPPGIALAYLPGPALAALLVAVGGYWPYYPNLYADWGNVAYYALCFLFGAAIGWWPGSETRLRAQVCGLLLMAGVGLLVVAIWGQSVPGRAGVGLLAWGAAAGALGLVGRHPPSAGPLLARLSALALPVYVLHHLPLLLIALALRPTHWVWQVQVPLIWALSIAVSLAAVHWLVVPWPLTRRLLGLPKSAASVA
jgi:glucan biosynthesis protein C